MTHLKMTGEMEQQLADVIQERPHGFSVDDCGVVRHFYLYPVTLGKMFSLQALTEQLEINHKNLMRNEMLEILRIVKDKREVCISILFIHTCKNSSETKDLLFDDEYRQERMALLDRCLSDEDIATLMLTVLSSDKTGEIIKHFGIDREQDAMRQVMKVKDSKNNITFGGKTLVGSFIHPLIEMGMDYEEIVWERSYSVLRLLLADKVNSVYVSDDELKKIPANIRNKDNTLKVTKESMETIKMMNWK